MTSRSTLALEGEAAPIGKADGDRGGEDLRRARERHDPGDHVDRHAADVAAHWLDLPGVDADPRLDPGIGQRGDDGGGASKRGDRAPEGGQEAVARGVDLRAAEPEQLGAHELVVIGEDLLPGAITEAVGGTGRVDDIGHQERRDDPFVLARHADRIAVAGEIEDVHRLVADHPGVVARRNIADVERPELDLFAVVHAHRESAREEDLHVMHRARCRPRPRSHVCRPPPSGLLDAIPDGVRADARYPNLGERKVMHRVRVVEAPAPDRTHRSMVRPERKRGAWLLHRCARHPVDTGEPFDAKRMATYPRHNP